MASEAHAAIGSSWVTIWTHPRATIRRIVDTDPHYQVAFLAMLTGALSVLESQWSRPPISAVPRTAAVWPLLVVGSVVGGAILGVVGLYINGFLLKWSGALLGGNATYAEVRAALAWAEIPSIVAIALGILLILIGGAAPLPALGQSPPTEPSVGSATMHAVLALWSFIITLKCLAEVHRFSVWRALASIVLLLIALLVFGLIVLLVVYGASKLPHPTVTV